ncbi:ZIP family metal transporter [Sutterella sp.]|uniref:ZIP family metal transporter n=1 Tax=Sutterella sp. TaxID=1981025 RepID=UPI0026E043E8|nr:ZIP family metal transporter [Sutterella sp.]MDO5531381.1 ZIP family metal transporter [Sutterella sp.]
MSALLFLEVFLANVLTRAAAIGCAFWLVARPFARHADAILAAACGFLVTMPLTHLLPEAFEAPGADPHALGLAMLATMGVFLAAEHLLGTGHAHEAHHDDHDGHAEHVLPALPGLFTAAALHSFVDGILIATTFFLDERAGWLAALAVLAHELPQQTGYFVILSSAGRSRRFSLLFCSGIAAAAVLGGFLGLGTIHAFEGLLPYALAMSAASFLYITLTSLLPEAFEGARGLRGNLSRLALVALGGILSIVLLGFAHGHDHADHVHEHAHVEAHVHDHAEQHADDHEHEVHDHEAHDDRARDHAAEEAAR